MSSLYDGRLNDVLAFQGPPATQQTVPVLLEQALAAEGEGGRICTGIQKLAQMTLMRLLTIRGSKPYDPLYGCFFMRDAAIGSWRTAGDVRASFAASLIDVRRQMNDLRTDTTPADEAFRSLSLDSVTFLGMGNVRLALTLTSASDERVTYITPITIPLR